MRIENEVLEVIERSNTVGAQLYLPGQLDRKLYVRVDKALQLAGGKWHRGHKAHLFDIPAADAIEQMVLTGHVVDTKREFDAFYTPALLAQIMCERAGIEPGQHVLEPSAGEGAIARELIKCGAIVFAWELRPEAAAHVDALVRPKGGACLVRDFLAVEPAPEGLYAADFDAVVMNPPFSKRQDVRHVSHALRFVKPGGRLVAIMSAGIQFRQDALTVALRNEINAHGGVMEVLPDVAFKESGTMVNAVMLVVTR